MSDEVLVAQLQTPRHAHQIELRRDGTWWNGSARLDSEEVCAAQGKVPIVMIIGGALVPLDIRWSVDYWSHSSPASLSIDLNIRLASLDMAKMLMAYAGAVLADVRKACTVNGACVVGEDAVAS